MDWEGDGSHMNVLGPFFNLLRAIAWFLLRPSVVWLLRYPPHHPAALIAVRKLVEENQLPHLLLYGPPGTGKTSTILALARQLYGKNMGSMVLELNASDDRGIGIVRNEIQDFAGTRSIFR